MKYLGQSFTLPAAGNRTTQERWDLGTLSKSQFIKKYGITEKIYGFVSEGETVAEVLAVHYRRA